MVAVAAGTAGTARKPSQTRTQGPRDRRWRERQTADGGTEGRVNVEAKRNNKHPPRADERDRPPPPSPISARATTAKPRRPIECVINTL